MKKIKKLELQEEVVKKSSFYISNWIHELLEQDKENRFIDGIFCLGKQEERDCFITLYIVYDNHQFQYQKERLLQLKDELQKLKINLRVENIPSWQYESDNKKRRKAGYPVEFSLLYGTILYDRCERLSRIKENLKEDTSLQDYVDYWIDVREIEPPITYMKK